MSTSNDFKIGDWVVFLPEPEKTFEIVAIPEVPYEINDGDFPSKFVPEQGFDFLLKRGLWGSETFQGMEQ